MILILYHLQKLTQRGSRPKSYNYKALRRRHKENLPATGVSDDFLAMTMKTQATKEKIDRLDFFKIKKFCASKGHYPESEKTAIEKIFANQISDKGLSYIYIYIYRAPRWLRW